MVRDKVRIRFRKSGDLRLVSHHDLMRCFERMLRRADLPVHRTEGFHPKPRLIFALSLGLGIIGHEEVAELELDAELPTDEIRDRLAGQAPVGLEIVSVERIDPKQGAQVRRAGYRIAFLTPPPSDLPERVDSFLTSAEAWVERTRPSPRRVNLRPYVEDLCVVSDSLQMKLIVTPGGTARPDELLRLLGLGDLLASGAVLERTELKLHDEISHLETVKGNA